MGELIAFRTLQGLGGGGLIVLAQAIIGDIVSPRDRGRYQGIFGAVFGVSSVAGPLIGGFLVDNASWRWIFYVNIPIGIVALAVIAVALRVPEQRRRGAHRRARDDPAQPRRGLLRAGHEPRRRRPTAGARGRSSASASSPSSRPRCSSRSRSARAEPVLPMSLFSQPRLHGGRRDRLHRRLRALRRDDLPAALPADRHRRLADRLGPRVAAADPRAARHLDRQRPDHRALGALPPVPDRGHGASWSSASGGSRRWSPDTSAVERSLDMLILGLGIGLVMQVLVLAVQNDVDYRNLGVATSGATFFRSIGGCFGVAICGAIFSNRLAAELVGASGLPPRSRRGPRHARAGRRSCRPPRTARFVGAYADALTHDLPRLRPDRGASPSSSSWLLPEKPLRRTVEATGVGEAFAAPKHHDPLPEIERALSTLARRDSRERILERLCRQAGVELTARQCWVLARVGESEPTDAFAIAEAHAVDPARVAARIGELRELGYVEGPERGRRAHRRRPRRARAARGGPSRAPGRAARRLVARARGRARRAAHAHGARRRRRPSRRRSAGRARSPPRA